MLTKKGSRESLTSQTGEIEVEVAEVEEEEVIEETEAAEVEVTEVEDQTQPPDKIPLAAKILAPEVADHKAQESTPTRTVQPKNELIIG